MRLSTITLPLSLLLACAGSDGRSADDAAPASSGDSSGLDSNGDDAGEADGDVASSSSDDAVVDSSGDGVDADSGTAADDGADVTTAGDESSTGAPPEVPAGVFLWTGSGGGGPGTDLYPEEVELVLVEAGTDVLLGDDLPADFVDRFGTIVYLNPTADFDPSVNAAAIDLVERGGRVVLVMEHCKNGCWGNADGHNALLEALGSGMTLHGDGGAPLADTSLTITAATPLTDGVDDLVVYYSGHVELATGDAVGAIDGGDVIVARESLGWGEVVAIADSSMLGYRLQAGDNAQLVRNFAAH
jgi:hypothetical protein